MKNRVTIKIDDRAMPVLERINANLEAIAGLLRENARLMSEFLAQALKGIESRP